MEKFIIGIPQLFKPETGIEAFVDSLVRAAEKYDKYFKDERKNC